MKVSIITDKWCDYCIKAKKLLNDNNITYNEISLSNEEGKRLMERDDLRTVPQIYFNDELIEGGYTGLKKYLEEQK